VGVLFVLASVLASYGVQESGRTGVWMAANALARLRLESAGVRGLWAQPVALGMSLLAALVAGRVQLFRQQPRGRFVDLSLFLLTVPAGLLFPNAVGFSKTYIERSALSALLFFMMLVSAGVLSAAKARWRGMAGALCVVFVVVVLVNYYRKSDRWTVYKPKPDWRSASRYFAAELAASSGVVPVLVGSHRLN
jgi:hypothetical protein